MARADRSSGVKTRVTQVAMLLLLGAIFNLAVACGCVATNPQWRTDLTILQAAACFNAAPPPIPPRHGGSGSSSAFLPDGELIPGPVSGRKRTWCHEITLGGTRHASYVSVRVGWPCLCLETARYDGRIDRLRTRTISGTADALQRTVWPGFAVNTIFYAAILWLLLAAPFALRRRLRKQRGLCPACAYPIGESATCTECGARVTPVPSTR
jgi:hypothetical protein